MVSVNVTWGHLDGLQLFRVQVYAYDDSLLTEYTDRARSHYGMYKAAARKWRSDNVARVVVMQVPCQ